MDKIVVIAAHPDDEALGPGATIAKHVRSGKHVTVVFATDGFLQGPNQDAEMQHKRECAMQAARVLGVRHVEFLGLPGLQLDTISLAGLAQQLTQQIEQHQPAIVYTHFPGDLNHDHQILAQASLVAARPHRNRLVKKVLFYQVPASTEWAAGLPGLPFHPTEFNVLEPGDLEKKLAAFSCYTTEIFAAPHPRSLEGIELLARSRGSQIHVRFAEAFMVVRSIID